MKGGRSRCVPARPASLAPSHRQTKQPTTQNQKKDRTMKGSAKVIKSFNKLLAGELRARDQYFIHSRLCANWGYGKLAELYGHEMAEETEHSDALIKRILLLDGEVDMEAEKVEAGKTIPQMLQNDLKLELAVRDNLKAAMKLCEEEQDYVSRDWLLQQLRDTEEDHAHWIEQHLGMIEKMGLENYLQSMI